jgi:peptidoglycan L-alanyl-D-glutamate endopeptidase CwlK
MASPLGPKSMDKLKGVRPDLVAVVKRAIFLSEVDFIVTEGVRSADKQAILVKAGASKTMNSRHLTGHAVDLAAMVNGEVRWDWPLYHKIAAAMKKAAAEEDVVIEWGGDWRTFKDGPHFQLPW